MSKAYMGKILMVDLSSKTMTEETIPDSVYQQYLSGMGLGAYILYNRIPAGADPLGPDNILGFCSGLLTGTGSLFSGRWTLVGKSPLTGGWGDANCGGTFSPAIKHCCYDAIFFKGISPNPVYLYVKTARRFSKMPRPVGNGCRRNGGETQETVRRESGRGGHRPCRRKGFFDFRCLYRQRQNRRPIGIRRCHGGEKT